jgi:hypothetical protein
VDAEKGTGAMIDDLEGLLAHHQIVQVGLAYATAIDRRDRALLQDCFTVDGVWSTPVGEARGAIAIGKGLGAIAHLDATQHVTTNQTVELLGDRATMRSCYIASHIRDGANLIMGGLYDDDLVRCDDGKWRIAYRKLTNLWTLGDIKVMGERYKGKL